MTTVVWPALTADAELQMADAVTRQGSTMPGGNGTPPPGMVLVAAIVPHKDGPPPKGQPDHRVKYLPGQTYWMEEQRAIRNEKQGIVYRVGSCSYDWWRDPGRVLSPWADVRETPRVDGPRPGSLKIVSGCGYDPGSQGYRFHNALSLATQHASCFVRWGDSNPHCSLRTLDGERDAAKTRQAVLDADVIHCHVAYYLLNNTGLARRPGQLLVRHYHGSRPDGGTHVQADLDEARGAFVVGARLSFYRDAADVSEKLGRAFRIHWLPITVPVQRYQALLGAPASDRVPTANRPFLIAHAPTKRNWKGTGNFLKAVQRLQGMGLPVKAQLIEGVDQRIALEKKRRCDATFDSFWLGLQTSGLEAAAMGQPVVAGDVDVKALHEQHVGYCPYTFANDEHALQETLERLVVDVEWRLSEAQRVQRYTVAFHDYPAVAARYERLLSERLKRPDILTPELHRASVEAAA